MELFLNMQAKLTITLDRIMSPNSEILLYRLILCNSGYRHSCCLSYEGLIFCNYWCYNACC